MSFQRQFEELTRSARSRSPRQRMSGFAKLYTLRYLVHGRCEHEFIGPKSFGNTVLASALGFDVDEEKYDPKAHRRRLRTMLAQAEKSAPQEHMPVLEANLDALTTLASLTTLDREVLRLIVLTKGVAGMSQLGYLIGDIETAQLYEVVAVMLDRDVSAVRASLARHGNLQKSGICSVDFTDTYVLQLKVDVLRGLSDRLLSEVAKEPLELLGGVVVRSPAPTLTLADFDTHMPLVRTASELFRQASASTKAKTLCLWGIAGTGKTESARLIAQAAGLESFEVATSSPDGNAVDIESRLKAFKAAQRLLRNRPAVVILDECVDLFEMRLSPGGDALSKGSLNEIIEASAVPTIFVLNENEMRHLSPAFLRRFSLVIEGRPPPMDRRRSLLEAAAGEYIDSRMIETIVAEPRATPAILKNATEVVDLVGGTESVEERRRMFCNIVEGVMRPQLRTPMLLDPRVTETDPFQLYDPRFANASVNLESVIDSARRHPTLRVLAFGPSGTGKSAWAKALANALGRPLQAERASDILSPWVGESEANLANIFARARREGTVLLFDEIEAIAVSRGTAKHQHERSLTSELLVQLESHDSGVVVLTCNYEAIIDSALRRRCDIKCRMDYLRADQSAEVLVKYCAWLGIESPSAGCLDDLSRLRCLTVGDFAMLSRQHRLLPIRSADDFVKRLAEEMALKQEDGARPRMGFIA